MTLSFTTHWRDELPDFYTSLSPTPLDNARLIWRNASLAQQLGCPTPCLRLKAGPVSGRRSAASGHVAAGAGI